MKQGNFSDTAICIRQLFFLLGGLQKGQNDKVQSCNVFLSFLSALEAFRHSGSVHDAFYTSCPALIRVYYVVMLTLGY